MSFKGTVVNFLREKGVTVKAVEQEDGDNVSVVFQVLSSDEDKVKSLIGEMEKNFNEPVTIEYVDAPAEPTKPVEPTEPESTDSKDSE